MSARRPKTPRRPSPSTKGAAPRQLSAERLLLDLARTLAERAGETSDLAAVIDASAAAYAPNAALPVALREDVRRQRDDKTARLALAWAREQVRLALVDVLEAARASRRLRVEGDVETLAWLWLAACEALAHEPAEAVPDRVHALRAFLTGG